MSRTWTGAVAAGSREYTPLEQARVVRLLKDSHTGFDRATDLADLCVDTGLPGRTVRAILADADGVEFVLAYDREGGTLYVAEYADEAEGHTRMLQARARRELDRAERRRQYADGLPRKQATLWS